MRPLRVAVVGPRRVRTGLGAFLARHLVAHGATVPAFLASTRETIESGRAALAAVGVEAEGFTRLDALLAEHPVDALAIASPHETHHGYLEAAIERGLHVLCEKPLVHRAAVPGLRDLLGRAARKGLVLFENCPWPYALPAFDALHPEARSGEVTVFAMEMAPSSTDPASMLTDAMSHPLSVLQELTHLMGVPAEDIRFHAAEPGHVDVAFSLERMDGAPVDARVVLRTAQVQPRPVALVVNGRRADRRVRMDDYAQSLADGPREVPLPDPMAALVAAFASAVREGEPAETAERRSMQILWRVARLYEFVEALPKS